MAVKYIRPSKDNTLPEMLELAREIQSKNFSNDTLVLLAATLSQRLKAEKIKSEILSGFLSGATAYATTTKQSYEERLKEIDADISQLEQAAFERCISAQKGKSAKNSALKRHVITHERKAEIVEYWKQQIPPATSNEEAARRLSSVFPGHAHRTLVSYVREAKTELA